jgi:AcrR family transcriptional regulator
MVVLSTRRSRKRLQTRDRLYQAAVRLFAEKGIAATTVEQITERADLGKGTFFNYFQSKEHVLGALAEIQLGICEAAVEDARAGHGSTGEILQRLGRSLSREPGRSPALVRSLMLAHLGNDAVRDLIRGRLAEGRALMAEIFALGQARGDVRRDLDPDTLAQFLQQSQLGMMLHWSIDPSIPLAERVEHTYQRLWDAVRSPRAEKGR